MSDNAKQQNEQAPINLSEFRSIHFNIDLQNLTSGVQVLGNTDVTFQEIRKDNTVVFTLPPGCCNSGHHILFKVVRGDTPKTEPVFQMELTAKVITLDPMRSGLSQVKVEVLQVQQAEWNEFLKLMNNRQDLINRLLERMRG